MTKKKYKIIGMHCTSCAMLIEGELEDIGVVARASYAKQELEVEYDEKKVKEEQIIKAVKKVGYDLLANK